MRENRVFLCLSLFGIAACAGGGSAVPLRWSAEETISASGSQLQRTIRLVGNERGTAIATWTDYSSALAPSAGVVVRNRFVPGHGWQGARQVALGVSRALEMDAAGNAFAMWSGEGSIPGVLSFFWSRFEMGYGWKSGWTEPIEVPGSSPSGWAVAQNGRALLAWSTETTLHTQDFDPRDGFVPSEVIPVAEDRTCLTGTLHWLEITHAFIDSRGDALIVWEDWCLRLETASVTRWATRLADQGWQVEGDWPVPDPSIRIASDDSGNILATWHDLRRGVARYALYTPSGGWAPPADVGTPPGFAPVSLDVSSSGHAVLLLGNRRDQLASTLFDPSVGWGPAEAIGEASDEADVAIDSSGRALAAWTHQSPGEASTLWVSRTAPWGPRRQVSKNQGLCPNDHFVQAPGAADVSLSETADGEALVIWRDCDCVGRSALKALHLTGY